MARSSSEAAPDRLYVRVPVGATEAGALAQAATHLARVLSPKLTGASARRLQPVSGEGWFGVRWLDSAQWFQERGVRGFTMRALAGKVIPMWIDDPTGVERKRNPKAKTRTLSGRVQVLIFRRAATIGARKSAVRGGVVTSVPQSYPGAPGRIARRQIAGPLTTPGRVAGQIAARNIGVRWHHPGLVGRHHIFEAIQRTLFDADLGGHQVLVGHVGEGV